MRHTWIVGLLLALLIRTPADAQVGDGNVEHNILPGMQLALSFMASDTFTPLHRDAMRLRGPVAEVRITVHQKPEHGGPDAEWTSREVGETLMRFDEHGCLTALRQGDLLNAKCTTEYRAINGKQLPANHTASMKYGETGEINRTFIFTYDEAGRLALVSSADKNDQSGAAYEYADDGTPRQAIFTKPFDEPDAYIYNKDGRLIEMTTIPETARRMTVTWLSPTQFELHQGPADHPVLMGKGTLDEHGALLHWSFRPPMRGPNMIGFRNEITYDDHGNWTQLISYTEAEPGEEKPSRPVIKHARQITYR